MSSLTQILWSLSYRYFLQRPDPMKYRSPVGLILDGNLIQLDVTLMR